MLRVVNVEPPTAAAVAAPPTASAVLAPTLSPSMLSKGCWIQGDSGMKKCAAKAAMCAILEEILQSFTLGKGKREVMCSLDKVEFVGVYPLCFLLGR